MNRTLAVFCLVLLLALFVLTVVTDTIRDSEITPGVLLIHFASGALSIWGGVLYCGFAAVHAVQRTEDPQDRAGWIILIVLGNLFGATLYLCTKYQLFRAIGKGSLMLDRRKRHLADFFKLTGKEADRVDTATGHAPQT